MVDAFQQIIGIPVRAVGNSASDSFYLDSADAAFAIIMQVPEAITITEIGFMFNTGNGISPNYKWSIQGVDTGGLPDGTIKGGGSPASVVEAGRITSGLEWHTLDNSYAATRGEFIALVIEHDNGTINGTNRVRITGRDAFGTGSTGGFPASRTSTTWTSTKTWIRGTNSVGGGAVKSTTKVLGQIMQRLAGDNLYNYSNALETGLRFNLDGDWGDTFDLMGAILVTERIANANDYHISLYHTKATPVQVVTKAFDADVV